MQIMKHKKLIEIYTDGSKTPTSCRYAVYCPDKELEDISQDFKLKPLTSNRAELYAIYVALNEITKLYTFNKLIIYSDSNYSIKSLTIWIKNWIKDDWIGSNKKPVKNKDLILDIYNLMQQYKRKIKLIHVKAHTGGTDPQSINNDIVDKLAKNII